MPARYPVQDRGCNCPNNSTPVSASDFGGTDLSGPGPAQPAWEQGLHQFLIFLSSQQESQEW